MPFIYMCAGHLAVDMWWTAIVPLVFLQVLETPPCRGGAAEILMCLGLDFNLYLVLQILTCVRLDYNYMP